jgi:hypothetical protein
MALAQRRPWLVRTSTAALALLLAAGAAAWFVHLVRSSEPGWNEYPWAYVLTAAIVFGGVTYALATWISGAVAVTVRRIGWGLMTAPLLVPSTFSLALPLLAPLVLTLGGATRFGPAPRTERSAPSS